MFGEQSSSAAGRVEAEGKQPLAGWFSGSAQWREGGLGSPGPAIAGGRGGGACASSAGGPHSWFCVPYRRVEGATVNVHEENV